MIRLYKEGTMHDFQGIKVDSVVVADEDREKYEADGWGDAWDILKPAKRDKIDANDSGALSTEEVRSAAKEAGIEGWDTKRIKTLKAELGV